MNYRPEIFDAYSKFLVPAPPPKRGRPRKRIVSLDDPDRAGILAARRREEKRTRIDPARDEVLATIEDAGVTDSDLAAACNVSSATIYAWRIAKVRRPRHLTMALILAALGKRFAIVDV